MVNILVLDGVSESGVQILKKDFNVDVMGSLSTSELKDIISKYDALLVRSQTKVNKEVIDASNLKIIARAGVGVDNIDVKAATQKGVIVVNSPDGNTIAAAEHTIAMLLSLSRFIPSANESLKKGEWERKKFTGVELYNKTLGVIGFGRIGSHVAKVCKALGMKVMVFDPYISASKAEELNIEVVELEKIFTESDFLTVHVPLTSETSNLINIETLKKMKKTARIVNCSRGGIINEDDLVYALENNIIAGAGLDVFQNEPLKESPLQKIQDKLIITPHLGASTQEAQINVSVDVAEQVSAYFKGEKVKSAVNLAGMDISESIKPYVNVALKLGMYLGQTATGNLKTLNIKYLGELSDTDQDTRVLDVTIVKGLLTPILGDTVNYVNAMSIAKDRNINVEKTKSYEKINYKSLITVKALFDTGEVSLAGTIGSHNEERIVEIDEYDINFKPEGKILITKNLDKPGMVGKVGTFLGQNNINIASMDLGRNTSINKAIMAINIDEKISEQCLDDMRSMEGIVEIKLVNF